MPDVTQILHQIESGDPSAAENLLPLVYEELRRLAAQKMAHEKPGQTLQATALVHDAWLRLVDVEKAQHWNSRGHFFSAAAEAMRRILVEKARRQRRLKRGGDLHHVDMAEIEMTISGPSTDVLALDEALTRLGEIKPQIADLVKFRYFAGLSEEQAAQALEMSIATAQRHWTYARAWLYRELNPDEDL